MSAKHTPGPWFVGAQNDALYIIDRRPAHDNDYLDHDADTACIARIHDNVRGAESSGPANARLIAAAPDLLQALQMARSVIDTDRQSFADCSLVRGLTEGDDPDNFVSIRGALFEQHDADVVADYDRALAQIDAAIAKATGAPA